jgi:long-chain fatty acid transport protein
MMRVARGLAVLAILLFSATTATAAGFRLPTGGAKAMGMGFAFTAQADDPSAIYYNPAGILQLEGTNVMAGVTYVKENGATFTGTTPIQATSISETQKDLDFWIPNAYFTRKVSPTFAYGVGVFSPFGLGQEYENPNTSIFRNQITKIELQTVVVNPTVAWKINDVLSVGAGIDFMFGKAELVRTAVSFGTPGLPPFGTNLFKAKLEGDGTAWGYNFGLLLTPSKNVKVGASYRSPFMLKIKDGDVTLTDNVAPFAAFGVPATSKADAKIWMPATAALGIACTYGKTTLEADIDWTFWSVFKSLPITNKSAALLSSNAAKNWKNVAAYRLGGQYQVSDPLAIRLGFVYDPSPVPWQTMGPELPDADRFNYNVGMGYKIGNVTVDAAYYYLVKKDRTVSNARLEGTNLVGFNGTWEGDAHLVALDVGYKF